MSSNRSYMLPASLWHHKRYQTTYKADYSHQLPQICGNLTNSSVLTRYTPEEWLISNQRHFNLADNTRAEAESMRSDAIRLIQYFISFEKAISNAFCSQAKMVSYILGTLNRKPKKDKRRQENALERGLLTLNTGKRNSIQKLTG